MRIIFYNFFVDNQLERVEASSVQLRILSAVIVNSWVIVWAIDLKCCLDLFALRFFSTDVSLVWMYKCTDSVELGKIWIKIPLILFKTCRVTLRDLILNKFCFTQNLERSSFNFGVKQLWRTLLLSLQPVRKPFRLYVFFLLLYVFHITLMR